MKNSLMYLTRRCVYNCDYCGIVDNSKKAKDELSTDEWKKVFEILKEIGVEFNLILGNEPWLLGKDLPGILNHTDLPYGVYTTCQHTLWERYKELYYLQEGVTNLSIGVDTPRPQLVHKKSEDDSVQKSWNAWAAFDWIKKYAPEVELHATITLHKENLHNIPRMVNELEVMGVFYNINFVHWNKDGGYDFFGETDTLKHLLFDKLEYPVIRSTLNYVLSIQKNLQNAEMLVQDVDKLVEMGWHCNGSPYDGPTVDSDGSLRVCGYRKGTRTPEFSIFDLPDKEKAWKQAVHDDAMDCPGCQWSCPWMYNYWKVKAPEKGTDIFTKHKVI